MAWKKRIHQQFGTSLIETTWAEVMGHRGLDGLEDALRERGIEPRWDPTRPTGKLPVVKTEQLVALVSTFMRHVKANDWTQEALEARLRSDPRPVFRSPRTRAFLDLYWHIHHRWQQRLSDEGYIDYDDMVIQAAKHLERGDVRPHYDLVLVDEFQDASQARARLVRGLVGRYRHLDAHVPEKSPAGLKVRFRTIHGAKGLEADYIVVTGVNNGRYGFPSTIEDDPVLEVVTADSDEFPHAEERRLFYVALTRARREVVLVATAGKESVFVAELMKAGRLLSESRPGDLPVTVCPSCGKGVMVAQDGEFGPFMGCNRYPLCRHTRTLKT